MSPIWRAGSDANQKFLAQQEGQLITHLHLAGVGRSNGQDIVLQFERHEVVAEHQVRGDGAKQFGVNALLAQINERKRYRSASLRANSRSLCSSPSPGSPGAGGSCSVVAMVLT